MIFVFSTWMIELKFKIKGSKINPAAAGEGIPSKKFIFQDSFSSIVVKLNLANLSAQHTE